MSLYYPYPYNYFTINETIGWLDDVFKFARETIRELNITDCNTIGSKYQCFYRIKTIYKSKLESFKSATWSVDVDYRKDFASSMLLRDKCINDSEFKLSTYFNADGDIQFFVTAK